MSSRSYEKASKKIAAPLAAAIGGAAAGSYLRGRKARKREEQAVRLARLAHDRAESAEEKSRTDHLTGLNTRSVFEENLNEVINRRGQSNRNSLLLIDIDDFKTINDKGGHAQGDQVLRHVADILKVNSRLGDTPARLGGDEMAVLLLRANEDQAAIVAERIRASVEAAGEAKVSIGIAGVDPDLGPEDNLSRADQALYDAKDQGRNGVAVYSSLKS